MTDARRTALGRVATLGWRVVRRVKGELYGLRSQREAARNRAFDLRHGTDTAAEIALAEAGLSDTAARAGNATYRALWEGTFHDVLDHVGTDFTGYTFVDIGSGKGKLLLLASRYPFAHIRGVELAPELCRIASANIARYRPEDQRCRDIVAEAGDALAYRLPDGPVVALMFNPFEGDLLGQVVAHLAAQGRDRSAPVYIAYVNVRTIAENAATAAAPDGYRVVSRRRQHVIWGNAATCGRSAS